MFDCNTTGDTSMHVRGEIAERFNTDPSIDAMLLTTQASAHTMPKYLLLIVLQSL
jgi:hypothetical protein